jgi:N utilization substance protein B
MTRKDARKAVLELLFESGFRSDENALEIYDVSAENRELENDQYVRGVFFGVLEHLSEIDEVIGAHSHGWKPERISRVARTVLRIAVYEMMYIEQIPYVVSINEAIELCKSAISVSMAEIRSMAAFFSRSPRASSSPISPTRTLPPS